jgi:hypothetical protein
MGITKKPAIIAKTQKKRGRPAGSKNKTVSSEGWVPPPTDWEKLAKRLQEALATEMKENEALKEVVEDFKKVIRLDSSFTFVDRLKFLITGKL